MIRGPRSEGGGSGSNSGSGSSSSSGGGVTLVNGCDPAKVEDHTNQAAVEIKFGDAVTGFFKYAPPCISVSKGTKVTFTGLFAAHPLRGGEVKAMVGTVDPASPITSTDAGTGATFTLANVGQVPYYCAAHTLQNMFGLIVVK